MVEVRVMVGSLFHIQSTIAHAFGFQSSLYGSRAREDLQNVAVIGDVEGVKVEI